MEEKVRDGLIEELKRQAAESGELELRQSGDRIEVHGPLDIDALVMVVMGAVAGGP